MESVGNIFGLRLDEDVANANNEADPGATDRRASFNDLPNKCLAAIFKHIPLQNLDDIIELSPRWEKIVQEHVPVEAHLSDIGFRVALHYYVGFTELPKFRIKVIHSRVLDEPLPDLKSPEDLQVVEFCTHTSLSTYRQLVKNSVNLQEMYFGYSSLTGEVLAEEPVEFPQLKVLQIADRMVECKKLDAEQMTILPRNIVGFLRKTFPSIRRLVISTVAHRQQTIEYAQALVQFVQRHRATLKAVKFIVRTSLFHVVQTAPIEDLTEFTSKEGLDTDLLADVQLSELDIRFGNRFFCGLSEWKSVLESQKQLKDIHVGVEKPLDPVIFKTPITQSADHLRTVEIGIAVFTQADDDSYISTPFDCTLFQNCHNLELLVLSGPLINPTSIRAGRSPTVELLHFDSLPRSLLCLGIDNIYVQTQQICQITEGISQQQRKLQKLSLQNIGTCADFGVTLDMLDSWIKEKTLLEVIVKKGITGDESQISGFPQLAKFGISSPLATCTAHAFYYCTFGEFRRPADVVEDKTPAFTFQ